MSDLSKLSNAELTAALVDAFYAGASWWQANGWTERSALGGAAEAHAATTTGEAASRLQAPAVAEVGVLKWKHTKYDAEVGNEPFDEAEGFGGYYVIEHRNAGPFDLWMPKQVDGQRFVTLAEAKAAAQADYEHRIRSALRTGGSE